MTEPSTTKLRAGDEVRVDWGEEFPGVSISGPVRADEEGCCLAVGPLTLVRDGSSTVPPGAHLTVTKLAPRPFYSNHEREEPVDGDVARSATSGERATYTWCDGRWYRIGSQALVRVGSEADHGGPMPAKLRLLVDGDTGLPPISPGPYTAEAVPETPTHVHTHDH